MRSCPKCGNSNDDSYLFCMQCGTKLDEDETLLVNDNQSSQDNDVPKTRVASNLEEFIAKNSEGEGAQTQIYQSTESRINPQFVQINDDQTDGKIYEITKVKTVIGRSEGDIQYPNDTYLSPAHCALHFDDGTMTVEDLASFNGVYKKISGKEKLYAGALILMGQQLLQFYPASIDSLKIPPKPETEIIVNFYGASNKKIFGLLKQIYSDRSEGNCYYLTHSRTIIGRQSGDISFPEDKFMSNQHAILITENDEYFMEDNESSNGIFTKIQSKQTLKEKDQLLIGKQLFEYRPPNI